MTIDFQKLLARENPDALIVLAPDEKILHWNRGAERIFGYASDEAVGRTLLELVVPAGREQEERILIREALDGAGGQAEVLRLKKDGSPIYASISTVAVRDDAGHLECFVSTKRDVTQLKVLRHSRLIDTQYGGLLKSMPDAIVILNDAGRIVFFSGQAEIVFGYTREELLGKPIEKLLPERFRTTHVSHRFGYFTQPRARSMGAGLELYGLRKNGEEFPVEISLSPLPTEEGTMALSAIRDVTERRNFALALQEKNVALEKASKAKDLFLASMSHELRTPLNAIIGFTGTLLMKLPGPLNADQERHLRTVQTSAQHLLSVINDLLDLAKIESGNVEITPEAVVCQHVVEDVFKALKPMAETKGLGFEVTSPAGELIVQTDRRALTQILINLTNNAIKFTSSGSVFIELLRSLPGTEPWTEISVTDTGPGLTAEDQAQLFRAFTRAGDRDQRAIDGTGLGLYISHRLAGLIGARITLRSAPGEGSCFSIIFDQ
jgi:PAS domain S-box-containing protein